MKKLKVVGYLDGKKAKTIPVMSELEGNQVARAIASDYDNVQLYEGKDAIRQWVGTQVIEWRLIDEEYADLGSIYDEELD